MSLCFASRGRTRAHAAAKGRAACRLTLVDVAGDSTPLGMAVITLDPAFTSMRAPYPQLDRFLASPLSHNQRRVIGLRLGF